MKGTISRIMPILLAMMIMIPLQGLGVFGATGNTYYVSAAGNDANTGIDAAQPFKTFKKAITVAVAGDVILAKGGTYSEKITVSKSGTAGAPITIKNMPGETPILDGTGMSPGDGDGMITIMNKSNIVINGFEIKNFKANSNSSVPIGIYVEGAGANIELLNNRIHNIENPNGNAHGIAVYGTNGSSAITNFTASGNEIYNCKLGQSESLVLNGNVDGFRVNNNTIHDNDNIGIDFIGYEGTASANDNARNGECIGNNVYNITSVGNPTYSDACADGIYVDGGKSILIDRNTVKNCDIGIEIATEQGPMTTDITVTNNVVTDCKPQAGISFGSAGGSNGGGVQNLKVFNNTLYNNTAAVQIQNANSSTNLIKGNIFKGGTAIEGNIGSNVFANNITADPLFVNASAGNFNLMAGSPAIDAGAEAYGSVDYLGNPRVAGAKVDAGAVEYQDGAVLVPVVPVPVVPVIEPIPVVVEPIPVVVEPIVPVVVEPVPAVEVPVLPVVVEPVPAVEEPVVPAVVEPIPIVTAPDKAAPESTAVEDADNTTSDHDCYSQRSSEERREARLETREARRAAREARRAARFAERYSFAQ